MASRFVFGALVLRNPDLFDFDIRGVFWSRCAPQAVVYRLADVVPPGGLRLAGKRDVRCNDRTFPAQVQ